MPVNDPVGIDDVRSRILGTWRMISWKRRLGEGGLEQDALGPNPFGYVGTYGVQDDRVIHALDGSWNELERS